MCVCVLRREYDFESVMSLASLVYGFLGCVTAGLYFLLRQLEASTSLTTVLCVYGYSLAIFIPASVSQQSSHTHTHCRFSLSLSLSLLTCHANSVLAVIYNMQAYESCALLYSS